MNATVGRKELHRAARAVCRVATGKEVLPIASHVLLSAAAERLVVTATDLSTCMEVPLPAQVEAAGAIAVPACRLRDLVAALPDADVHLEAGERNTLRVVCGTSEYVLCGLPAAEFPTLATLKDARRLDVPQGIMARMIREVVFACSTDETGALLCGAYFDACMGRLQLAGTDTYRLAVSTASMEDPEQSTLEPAIIPAQMLRELGRVLGDTGTVAVEIGEHNVRLSVPGLSLVSRLCSGEYPHFERIIPKELPQQLVFERQAALNALRCLRSILPRNAECAVRLQVGEGVLRMAVGSEDVGSGCERVPCSCNDDRFEMGFDPRYLAEGLQAISTQHARLESAPADGDGRLKPVVLRPVDAPDGEGYLYCLAPCALK